MLSFEKRCCHFFSAVLDGILFILTGNDDIHKSLDEVEIRPDPTTNHRVSCPLASVKLIFPFFLALYTGSLVSIVALWATCFSCYYVVSVRRGFLFLLVLGIGCLILLWHSLGIQYNYFVVRQFRYETLKKRRNDDPLISLYKGLKSTAKLEDKWSYKRSPDIDIWA